MNKIKVLVVDDSAVYRRLICNAIIKDNQIEVVGTASNGRVALEMIKRLNPDVVTLDLEMPEMDGLETLQELKKNHIDVGVIVFSSHSQAGAKMTFEALERGAFDFVPKPSDGSFSQNLSKISSLLIPRIRVCYLRKGKKREILDKKSPLSIRRLDLPFQKKEAVAIGVSTGGPNALKEVFSNLSPDINAPIFVVQHMPPLFTSQFAERLDKLCPLKVKEAENGEQIKNGVVYIAPGDYHMELMDYNSNNAIIKLHKGPPENNCRPSVDVLFRSVANIYGKKALCVILTGMGNDGLKGSKILKEKGAYIIAQDENTSVVWGMPKAVVEAGLADKVLPLEQIPKIISELTKR